MLAKFDAIEKELNEKFNLLERQRQELLQRINEILQEQVRLQGEYRLLQRLKSIEEVKNASNN
ncbi:MAG: hypothetical protein AB1478_04990 [Nitrospirota bacterium]